MKIVLNRGQVVNFFDKGFRKRYNPTFEVINKDSILFIDIKTDTGKRVGLYREFLEPKYQPSTSLFLSDEMLNLLSIIAPGKTTNQIDSIVADWFNKIPETEKTGKTYVYPQDVVFVGVDKLVGKLY